MDAREFEGLKLAALANIEFRKTYFYVPSASHEGGHRVNHDATECSCEDFELRGQPCKHCFAVKFVKERNRGTPLPETKDDEPPPVKRATYKQAWTQYNAAQTHEKELFLPLLSDLCRGIPFTNTVSILQTCHTTGAVPQRRGRDPRDAELGIDPAGFGSPPKAEPRIIRFPGA